MKVLFITPDEVTKFTPIGGNIDVDKLLPCIYNVQVSVIEKMLGVELYEQMLIDYEAGTLTGDYLTLLDDYIKPIIRYQTAGEYIEIGAYFVGNAGIFKKNPSDAENVSKSEIDALAQTLRATAQMYIGRAERFMEKVGITNCGCGNNNTEVVGGWYFRR